MLTFSDKHSDSSDHCDQRYYSFRNVNSSFMSDSYSVLFKRMYSLASPMVDISDFAKSCRPSRAELNLFTISVSVLGGKKSFVARDFCLSWPEHCVTHLDSFCSFITHHFEYFSFCQSTIFIFIWAVLSMSETIVSKPMAHEECFHE